MRKIQLNYHKSFVLVVSLLLSVFFSKQSRSQDVQTWYDYYLIKPIGEQFEFELNPGFDKLMQKDGWGDFYLCNTLSFQPANWYLADGSLELHYTYDPLAQNMTEVRVFIGSRFNFTRYIDKINLQSPYAYVRIEQRFLGYPEDGTTDRKKRIRARIGGRFLLNNDNLTDGTFYLPFYFEYFFNFEGDAYERFASRNRIVAGLGYAFNSRWRTELMYYGQRSRHSYEDNFEKTDVIFQLNVKYYWLKKAE